MKYFSLIMAFPNILMGICEQRFFHGAVNWIAAGICIGIFLEQNIFNTKKKSK